MPDATPRSLHDLVKHLGRYPEEAFLFLREALGFAADRVHGEETEPHKLLQKHIMDNELDWSDLAAAYHAGELPEELVDAINEAGGPEKLNRHVSGRELCWALRDYALQRWGIMARVVLDSWGIHRTQDFGRIVFAFIHFDLMRKQPEDRMEDFDDVFSFDEAFGPLPSASVETRGRQLPAA